MVTQTQKMLVQDSFAAIAPMLQGAAVQTAMFAGELAADPAA